MLIDQTLAKLRGVLSVEREETHIHDLTELTAHRLRRAAISTYMADIDAERKPVRHAINALPRLPAESEISWAQAILSMSITESVRFLEVDTTGLSEHDEIVRVTVVNLAGIVCDDILIKPSRPMSAEACIANGLTDADLQDAPNIIEMWDRICASVHGRYIIGYVQQFDMKKLTEAATRHQLAPITIIGDDLQRHATAYYHKEYYLNLETLCERVGQPLASRTAVDRAKGQCAIVRAMAKGVMDVRPPKAAPPASEVVPETIDTNDDGLSGLDEHPVRLDSLSEHPF